jgi:hypothetical protein
LLIGEVGVGGWTHCGFFGVGVVDVGVGVDVDVVVVGVVGVGVADVGVVDVVDVVVDVDVVASTTDPKKEFLRLGVLDMLREFTVGGGVFDCSVV